MSKQVSNSSIAGGRLEKDAYEANFTDLHAPLSAHEAAVEADRCYFCHDAPCVVACPTEIDIPLFIRQISTRDVTGSAKTIFDQNILGGMCARVCPTETLCEEKCVRNLAEDKPVEIGLLQRFATDAAMAGNHQFYTRPASSGKKVAVIGAGPAGLACAHRLAMLGHLVEIFEAEKKSGGLNEYGIAAYKTIDNFAQREVDYVCAIGGVSIQHNTKLGENIHLEKLTQDYDAVFLGMGLGDVNQLALDGHSGVEDAVAFISSLRQSQDLSKLPVGKSVVVIGGGMTAIDAAVQAKLLGSSEVTICYRRGGEQMGASKFEQDLATSKGVIIRHWLQPDGIDETEGAVRFAVARQKAGKLEPTGETISIPADQVLVAIGQKLDPFGLEGAGVEITNGRIKIDENGRTGNDRIWAGGDCVAGGEDLTVSAVAMGRDAAHAMDATLTGKGN